MVGKNAWLARVNKALVERAHEWGAVGQESDRACVLVAAEILSQGLERLLVEKFTSVGLSVDDQHAMLGTSTAPLASFAMRTVFCRAFGLLSPEICKWLDVFREIRNHCAHHTRVVGWDDKEMRSHVRAIQEFVQAQNAYKRLPPPKKSVKLIQQWLSGEISAQRWKITGEKRR